MKNLLEANNKLFEESSQSKKESSIIVEYGSGSSVSLQPSFPPLVIWSISKRVTSANSLSLKEKIMKVLLKRRGNQ